MKLHDVLLTACLLLPFAATAQDSSFKSSNDIDITELIAKVAKRTNKQLVVDPRVRAQVPLAGIAAGDLTWEQFLAVLHVHQFSVVNAGGLLAVVPDANARQLPTAVYTDTNFKAPDYETVTLLATPKKLCAAQLVPVLRPLMPQAAHLAAEVQSNTLIINDDAVNVRRIAELIEQLDKRGPGARDCAAPFMAAAPAATLVKPKDKD